MNKFTVTTFPLNYDPSSDAMNLLRKVGDKLTAFYQTDVKAAYSPREAQTDVFEFVIQQPRVGMFCKISKRHTQTCLNDQVTFDDLFRNIIRMIDKQINQGP